MDAIEVAMRIAVVSDIHGNLTAFEDVLADLRHTAPDFVLHGGDLAEPGAHPTEIIDRIGELSWNGVAGNTDELLFRPESLAEFAAQSSPAFAQLFAATAEMAAANRATLGEERLTWLRDLPRAYRQDSVALVHASPGDLWRAPVLEASDADLESLYSSLAGDVIVYGHIHMPYIRNIGERIIANSGSVGLPYDGDRRASYLLLDDGKPSIRRVEYRLESELQALACRDLPHVEWIARSLRSARPELP
ncbi:MAG TPA: metallophosphoesterase family protein [Acidobacteriaceae bacterium]